MMFPESLGFSCTTIEFWGWFVFIIWCYFSVFTLLETVLQGRMGNPEINEIESNQGQQNGQHDFRIDSHLLEKCSEIIPDIYPE